MYIPSGNVECGILDSDIRICVCLLVSDLYESYSRTCAVCIGCGALVVVHLFLRLVTNSQMAFLVEVVLLLHMVHLLQMMALLLQIAHLLQVFLMFVM